MKGRDYAYRKEACCEDRYQDGRQGTGEDRREGPGQEEVGAVGASGCRAILVA
jgi:hypothetical protein